MPRRARLADGGLTEDAFSSQVEGLASFYGWRGYHTHDSRRSARGFPDWVFVRNDSPAAELLFVELKAERGRLGPGQAEWIDDLGAVARGVADLLKYAASRTVVPVIAVEVYLWRPSDWPAIERRLAAGRHRQPSVNAP